jgi:glutathione S-transferase
MADDLHLLGYRYSVYTRIVRMALIEMSLEASYAEVDPFAATPDPTLARYSPFDHVPVLRDGDFVLTETAAILRYLNAVGPGLSLVPTPAKPLARMAQVIGIVDAYAYRPMVRKVFSAAVFGPFEGRPVDPGLLAEGLKEARAPLRALDAIAAEGHQLDGNDITLADLHLAPMMAYFVMPDAGAEALRDHPALSRWWDAVADRPSLLQTDPFAPA